MRSIAVVGVAFAALLGLATTEPAAAWEGAWEDGRNYKGTDIYVHHYVFSPPRRIRHVYHMLPSGPYHAHFVNYDTTPYVSVDRGASDWYWRGPCCRRW